MHERKVKIRAHSYEEVVEDKAGRKAVIVRNANRGDVIEVDDAELERGERLGAFFAPGEEAELAAQVEADEAADGETPDISLMGEDELISFVESHTVSEVVEAAGDDPDNARALVQAEESSEGDARKGVIDGLATIINRDNG